MSEQKKETPEEKAERERVNKAMRAWFGLD